MNIQAIFFDVDQTLISHATGRISKKTQAALQTLKQKRILIFLATGRHTTELEDLGLTSLSFDGYVTLNGQLCMDAKEKIIFDNPIQDPDRTILIDCFHQMRFPLVMVEKNRLYINQITDQVRLAQQAISTDVPPIDTYQGASVYQCTAFIDARQTRILKSKLQDCQITRWNPYGVDIISRQGGKANGIAKILRHYNIPKENVMAFGDGENDMEMLAYAGIGVAMGNANPKLKEIADYVTDEAKNDGIVKALEHFNLL